jgi:hypothetical protein
MLIPSRLKSIFFKSLVFGCYLYEQIDATNHTIPVAQSRQIPYHFHKNTPKIKYEQPYPKLILLNFTKF